MVTFLFIFMLSLVTRHGHITRPPPGTGYVLVTRSSRFYHLPTSKPRIKVHFKDSNGDLLKTVEVNEGDDILSIAHEHDIDLEGAQPCSSPFMNI